MVKFILFTITRFQTKTPYADEDGKGADDYGNITRSINIYHGSPQV